MLRLILFWLLRVLSVTFIIVNLTYLEVNGFWGVAAVIFGIFSCLNLYVWGLFSRETNKKVPGLFLLFRVIQGILVFIFDAMATSYFATYIFMDLIYYAILLYDSRFKFIYKEPRSTTNTRIRIDK